LLAICVAGLLLAERTKRRWSLAEWLQIFRPTLSFSSLFDFLIFPFSSLRGYLTFDRVLNESSRAPGLYFSFFSFSELVSEFWILNFGFGVHT
jgi:hypothetical protein